MTCQSPACDCEIPAESDQQFCSTQCESAVTFGKPGERCACGHSSCGATADETARQGDEAVPPA